MGAVSDLFDAEGIGIAVAWARGCPTGPKGWPHAAWH
jgi:hypothetical protein